MPMLSAVNRCIALQNPTTWMMGETDMPIVAVGGRRRQQDQTALRPKLFLGQDLQPFADTPFLVCSVYRQVGEIAGIVVIGDGAGQADQLSGLPSADRKIAVGDHAGHARSIMNGTAFTEGRAFQQGDELIGGDGVVDLVFNAHRFSRFHLEDPPRNGDCGPPPTDSRQDP